MQFSRQEYWSGLLFPSPEDLPNPGIEPRSPALQADSLLSKLLARSYLLEWLQFKKKKSDGKDMGKLEHLCIVVGNIKWYSCYGKWYGSSSKKVK